MLPDADRFTEIEHAINADWLGALVSGLRRGSVRLGLPRWKVRSQVNLNEILKSLGMPLAFDAGADFRGITRQERHWIAAVQHEGWIAVDENGTEAAAATAVLMTGVSAQGGTDQLVADRPFLYVIRDVPTGTPLFIGRVTDPMA